MRRDIDEALRSWPHDPRDGEVVARVVRAKNGRSVLQIRLELGLMQMEVVGRPDGTRPLGFDTYLDFLRQRSMRDESNGGAWRLGPGHCEEIDRELVQYTHRRMAWLSLHEYRRALADADHTLAMLDFVGQHAPDAGYAARHERFRGMVIYHRTQAAVALALESREPEQAVQVVRDGIDRLEAHLEPKEDEEEAEESGSGERATLPTDLLLLEQLRELEAEIRRLHPIPKSLQQQLAEAVGREDYEAAAKLRDTIRRRARHEGSRG